jgi:uroporphyrinogen-III decarboxylase
MHDDIVWTSGPVFSPEWYRKHIFPRYREFWKPVREAGKKIIFCADGTWTMFIDDVADAGADGFIFEPSTSLDYVVEKYGQTHVIMGNADCRVLQFGSKDDIRREVERCVTLGKACPGYFMCMSNHIPNCIPIEHIEYYFEVFEEMRVR